MKMTSFKVDENIMKKVNNEVRDDVIRSISYENVGKCGNLEETNLDAVKSIAKLLLNFPIHFDKDFPIVHHPIFRDRYIINREIYEDNGAPKLLDICEKDNLKYATKVYSEQISQVKSYSDFLIIINKPYLGIFLKMTSNLLSKEDFASFLSSAWTYMEFPGSSRDEVTIDEYLSYFKEADKEYLMTDEERASLEDFPEEVEIFRGVLNDKESVSISWTVDRDVAEWFAKRFLQSGTSGTLLSAKINKKDIVAYFTRRSESEVIVDYNGVRDIKVVESYEA